MEDCANGYAAYILELVEAAKETCAAPVVLIEHVLILSLVEQASELRMHHHFRWNAPCH